MFCFYFGGKEHRFHVILVITTVLSCLGFVSKTRIGPDCRRLFKKPKSKISFWALFLQITIDYETGFGSVDDVAISDGCCRSGFGHGPPWDVL